MKFQAMEFAREAHKRQVRKYTGNPYTDHLAEVAGIVATVSDNPLQLAVAWLHDYIEDIEPVNGAEILKANFGIYCMRGVLWLSDLETQGNRAERKAASRARLAAAPGWVQTIKCADLISNTSSIVKHDPKFAVVYLEEKRLLLHMLAQQCNMVPGDFIWTGGDCHIYDNHLEQVALQLSRTPYPYPTLRINRKPASIFDYKIEDFEFEGYQHHPAIRGKVAI